MTNSCRRIAPILCLVFGALLEIATPSSTFTQGAGVQPPTLAVSDTVQEIRLSDGSVLYGRITAIVNDRVTIVLESGGSIDVPRSTIASAQPVRTRLVAGERWENDPNTTRLFFGPTARAVGAGAGYFAVYELFLPYLTFGLTNAITFSGGTPIVPGGMGELMYLAPKVTFVNTERTALAAGVLAVFLPEDNGSGGLLYGVGTFGSRDNALTVGAAVPFASSGGFGDMPVLMVGSESRSGRRTKFITESYFLASESVLLASGGFRFFGERLSADAGLGFFAGEGETLCCIPLVNFVYSWGPQRGRGSAAPASPPGESAASRALATGRAGGTRTRR